MKKNMEKKLTKKSILLTAALILGMQPLAVFGMQPLAVRPDAHQSTLQKNINLNNQLSKQEPTSKPFAAMLLSACRQTFDKLCHKTQCTLKKAQTTWKDCYDKAPVTTIAGSGILSVGALSLAACTLTWLWGKLFGKKVEKDKDWVMVGQEMLALKKQQKELEQNKKDLEQKQKELEQKKNACEQTNKKLHIKNMVQKAATNVATKEIANNLIEKYENFEEPFENDPRFFGNKTHTKKWLPLAHANNTLDFTNFSITKEKLEQLKNELKEKKEKYLASHHKPLPQTPIQKLENQNLTGSFFDANSYNPNNQQNDIVVPNEVPNDQDNIENSELSKKIEELEKNLEAKQDLQYDLLNAVQADLYGAIPGFVKAKADINALYDNLPSSVESMYNADSSNLNAKKGCLLEATDNIAMLCCLFANGAKIPDKKSGENCFLSILRNFNTAQDNKNLSQFLTTSLGQNALENWEYICQILLWQKAEVIDAVCAALNNDQKTNLRLTNGAKSVYLRLYGHAVALEDLKLQKYWENLCRGAMIDDQNFTQECTSSFASVFTTATAETAKEAQDANKSVFVGKLTGLVTNLNDKLTAYNKALSTADMDTAKAKKEIRECVRVIAELLLQADEIAINLELLGQKFKNAELNSSIMASKFPATNSFMGKSILGKSILEEYQKQPLTASIMMKSPSSNQQFKNRTLERLAYKIYAWVTNKIKAMEAKAKEKQKEKNEENEQAEPGTLLDQILKQRVRLNKPKALEKKVENKNEIQKLIDQTVINNQIDDDDDDDDDDDKNEWYDNKPQNKIEDKIESKKNEKSPTLLDDATIGYGKTIKQKIAALYEKPTVTKIEVHQDSKLSDKEDLGAALLAAMNKRRKAIIGDSGYE